MRPPPAVDADAFAGKLLAGAISAFEVQAVYLGRALGLYQAFGGKPRTPRQLARRARIAERYAREWMEQQAIAGVLQVQGESRAPSARRFALPNAYAEVLLDETSPRFAGFLPRYAVSAAKMAPQLQAAFRRGGGVAWASYGDDLWRAQAEQNRPFLTHQFVRDYVRRIPEVHDAIRVPGARIADIACGAGWSSLALARGYPEAKVDGFDLDAKAIAAARASAREAGLRSRVRFFVKDAGKTREPGRYDLAVVVEALHDFSRPVAVLRAARRLLKPGAPLLVVDENVPDRFRAPGTELDRLFYGFSVLFCLPNGLADRPSAATGTVMRPAKVASYGRRAGFSSVKTLPLAHDFFRFYLMRR